MLQLLPWAASAGCLTPIECTRSLSTTIGAQTVIANQFFSVLIAGMQVKRDRKAVQTALLAWQHHVFHLHQAGDADERLHQHHRNSVASAVLAALRHRAQRCQAQHAALLRAQRKLARSLAQRIWLQWLASCALQRKQRNALSSVLQSRDEHRCDRFAHCTPFLKVAYLTCVCTDNCMCSALATGLAKCRYRIAFATWAASAQHAKHLAGNLHLHLEHSRKRITRDVLLAWSARARKLRAQLAALQERVDKAQAGLVSHSFNTWLATVAECRCERALVAKGQRRVQRVVLRALLQAWAHRAAARLQRQHQAAHVAQMKAQSLRLHAWMAWRQLVASHQAAVLILNKVDASRTRQCQRDAFHAWSARCIRIKRVRELAAEANTALLQRSLQSWTRHTLLLRRRREAYCAMVKRFASRAVTEAFSAWHAHVTQRWSLRRAAHARLEHALVACVHVRADWLLGAAFDSWHAGALVAKGAEADQSAAAEAGKQQMLREYLATWRQAARAGSRQCTRLQHLMRKVAVRRQRAAWQLWTQRVEDARLQRIGELRAATHFLQRTLRAAVTQWRLSLQEKQAMRTRVQVAQRRLARSALLRTLTAWWRVVRQQRRWNVCVQRMMHRRTQLQLRCCVVLWAREAAQCAADRRAADDAMHNECRGVLHVWHAAACQQTQQHQQALALMSRQRARLQLRAALIKWAACSSQRKRHRNLIARFALRRERKRMHGAWCTWSAAMWDSQRRLAHVHRRRVLLAKRVFLFHCIRMQTAIPFVLMFKQRLYYAARMFLCTPCMSASELTYDSDAA